MNNQELPVSKNITEITCKTCNATTKYVVRYDPAVDGFVIICEVCNKVDQKYYEY